MTTLCILLQLMNMVLLDYLEKWLNAQLWWVEPGRWCDRRGWEYHWIYRENPLESDMAISWETLWKRTRIRLLFLLFLHQFPFLTRSKSAAAEPETRAGQYLSNRWRSIFCRLEEILYRHEILERVVWFSSLKIVKFNLHPNLKRYRPKKSFERS